MICTRMGLLLLILFSLPTLGRAVVWQQPPQPESTEDEFALLLKLNREIKPIEVANIEGTKRYLANLAGHKALVVVFLDFRCPISNRMIPVLNDLTARYTGLDVAIAGVVCGGVTLDELVSKKRNIGFNSSSFVTRI